MSGLAIRGLKVTFGAGRGRLAAVDGVDLDVPPGRVLGLVGESGSGKSTIARAIVGLAPVSGGHIYLDGRDITRTRGAGRSRLRRRVQLIFQDPYSSLNPRMPVGEAIAEASASHHRMTRQERTREVARLLELVALDPADARLLPRQFSGGQRQRIAIARALAVRPDLIVADEITSSLDVSVQASVLNLIRDIRAELGVSMLFISHNLAVVRYTSDIIAVMHLGKIVEVASNVELFSRPCHPYTRVLLESLPSARPSRDREGMALEGETPDPHDPPPGCRFHTRCPIGPRARPDRSICVEQDPHQVTSSNPHSAACHFPLGPRVVDRPDIDGW